VCVSDESKELTKKVIETMKEEKPTCKLPDKPEIWHSSAQLLLNRGLSIDQIIKILQWALRDNTVRGEWKGWAGPLWHSKNKLAYLYDKFDIIETQMKTRTERKFAPCSRDEIGLKALERMNETAL